MWPKKVNINQKDGILSNLNASQDEILNALLLWNMPLEAYPKELKSAKLVWYIPQPGAGDIAVDVHMQAFGVQYNKGIYYSFWCTIKSFLDLLMMSMPTHRRGISPPGAPI